MFNLEKSIKEWLRKIRKHQAFDDGTQQEMEVHLRDHIEDLISEGYTEKEAFDLAVQEFGDIQPVAKEEYTTIARKPTIGSLLRLAIMKSYFKVVLRSLLKNPLHSFINIFGLSTALGIAIFVFAYSNWVFRTDQFHENKDRVYLSTYYADRNGEEKQFGKSPQALAEQLKEDFPQINMVCRVEDRGAIVKRDGDVFRERIRLVDPSFLKMLTFPLSAGVASSLSDINSIILSHEMALKYFGNEDPVGQELELIFSEENKKVFKVTGVAEKFPESRTISFNFLINYKNLRHLEASYKSEDWESMISATLIVVEDASDINTIQNGMSTYQKLHNEAVDEEWAIKDFNFITLGEIHKESEFIENDISVNYGGNYSSIYYLGVVAVMMLVLACFNYINIAIVSAAKRLKEIGLRKTIGASRSAVIRQFLSENMVISGFALIIGLILAIAIFIPGFEKMFQFNMGFTWDNPWLYIFLIAVVFVTSFLSGLYPSLYISKFEVVKIFRGNIRFGKRNPVTKILLGGQLILACVFITSAVMFTQNSQYLAERDWGYDPKNKIYVRVDDSDDFGQLEVEMAKHPDVVSISGSAQHVGKENTSVIITHSDEELEVKHLGVNPEYFETMDLRLTAGRFFNKQEGSDTQSIVVNEKLVETLGLTEPVGETVKLANEIYTIVGVLENYHHLHFQNEIKPSMFTVANKKEIRFLTLKVREGTSSETFSELKETWASLFPEAPFNGGFQEDVWGYYFTEIKIHGIVWTVFAIIAALTAGLGLYGLITLNIEGRIKEFSIRKVLGADKANVSKAVAQNYTLLFIISLVLGLPLGFYAIKTLITFAYRVHMPITYEGIYLTAIFVVSILLATLFIQIYRVLHMNTVKGLKTE